jgi:hypothetical protein
VKDKVLGVSSGYGTITPACEVICSRNAIFSQRGCGCYVPPEENHEETQQTGDDHCRRRFRFRRWRPGNQQLAQQLRRSLENQWWPVLA